jgi:hypothetical protein
MKKIVAIAIILTGSFVYAQNNLPAKDTVVQGFITKVGNAVVIGKKDTPPEMYWYMYENGCNFKQYMEGPIDQMTVFAIQTLENVGFALDEPTEDLGYTKGTKGYWFHNEEVDFFTFLILKLVIS